MKHDLVTVFCLFWNTGHLKRGITQRRLQSGVADCLEFPRLWLGLWVMAGLATRQMCVGLDGGVLQKVIGSEG